ncbi:MAG: helix-turn-helix domain-containing protein [Chitinophagales bacterium]
MENRELELAWNFVEKTNRNIFLTGKAGTGKTTFLRKIKAESNKRMIVVAPTGVAAINARGVTIHSFFQLPFGPIIPGAQQQKSAYKFNKIKINIIRSLDLLVIDEISMVRADLLDGIDQVLRKYKNRNEVFGGVQVLLIGDVQQLAPVIKPNEWSLLKAHYDNAYFFSSKAYLASKPIAIELKHIYRQGDEKFIQVLNEIRTNTLSEASAKILNKRYKPDFEPKEDSDYITLTTHNNRADKLNWAAYEKLDTKQQVFKAKIEGKYPEYAYPCAENLKLRIGAQVMFTKNDSSHEKKYFNGKIGEIIALNHKEILVKCGEEEISVVPEVWENISFNVHQETKEIEEKKEGSYTQMPLKLAWAITIHKSQGLTFEKAIIDAGSSFAHGQTYVALSRCKTLEGIILKTKINSNSIINDGNVTNFSEDVEKNIPNQEVLNTSKKLYQISLVNELFHFKNFIYPSHRLLDILYKNSNSIQGNLIDKIPYVLQNVEKISKVSEKFKLEILELSTSITDLEKDENIQTRISKACDYYLSFVDSFIQKPLKEVTFSTDNKEVKKNLKYQFNSLMDLMQTKYYIFKHLNTGFSTSTYLNIKAKAVLQDFKPKKEKEVYNLETENQELFENLKNYRKLQAKMHEIEEQNVCTLRSLNDISNLLPCSLKQLSKVNGIGKVRLDAYGEEIVQIVKNYCDKKEIKYTVDSASFNKPKKGSSKMISLEMFQANKSIIDIAKEREFAESTIQGHLADFILTGEIKANQLMPDDKFAELKKLMTTIKYEGSGDLKAKIDNKFSYGDIKIVTNHLEYEKSLKL